MNEEQVKIQAILDYYFRIAPSFSDTGNWTERHQLASQEISKLFEKSFEQMAKERGWVQLAEDQSLPPNPHFREVNGECYNEYPQFNIYDESQQAMLKANFRRVKLEEK